MDLNSNEEIKTFLKIDAPKVEDKTYYTINETRNIITLFDSVDKGPSDKSSDFEEDKIFTETDENSYIYEEICKDTVKESLNGISYSFISYGEFTSNKLKLIIGDVKDYLSNCNSRGLFPRLLDNLIKKEKSQKNMKEKINLKISYFLVHDNDMIDLSYLKNKNNLTENKLYQNKETIKNNEENIIDKIQKVNIQELENELSFLHNIINLLNELKENEEDESKNIFSRAHMCINIYIENESNEKKSIINFLILNGSEYLYSRRAEEFKTTYNEIKKSNKNVIKGTKIALETQYTYETLLNLVKLKVNIDNNIDSLNSDDINLIINKNNENSKLTLILHKLFFSTSKIKFRIIGSVTPNIGLYQNFKDTLLFLFDFHNLIKSTKKKNSSNIVLSTIQRSLTNNMIFQNLKKDNIVFELENKISSYKKTIDDYKAKLQQKDKKISFLEQSYKEQINIIKKKFNFNGDINVLISGDENTKEAEIIKNFKEMSENNIRNEGNLRLLQKTLDSAKEEIKRLKNREEVLNTNDTMIKYYLYAQKNNEEKKKDNNDINDAFTQIEKLKKEIAFKNRLLDKYRQEIDNTKKVLLKIPKNLKDSDLNLHYNESKKDDETKLNENEEGNLKKNSINSDNIYIDEIKQIKKDNQKKIEIIKLNYEKKIQEKINEIKKMEYNYEGLKLEKKKDLYKYGNEIIKLNKILMNLISNYKRIFDSNLTKKCSIINLNLKKEEFGNIIMNADKDINFNNFPLLYQSLLNTNQLKMNQPFLHSNMKKVYTPLTINKNDEEIKDDKLNNTKNKIENNFKSEIPKTGEQISQFFKEQTNDGKIIFSKEQLEEMSKEAIVIHCLNINNKLIGIENYLKKYVKYKKGFNVEEFEKGEKYKDEIIDELKNKVNKLEISLDEQIKINNKNICVINSQNRKIDKLQKDTILYNNLLKYKNINSSILTPNKSTLYNSFVNDISNRNNFDNKTLKKSSSVLSINKVNYPLSPKIKKISAKKSINQLSRQLSPKIREIRENKIYLKKSDI